MDARPQRPIRALHIQGDENAGPAKQILHQRHKSTGTLSTMLAAGGLKVAAKRTAFGDVSNTAKNIGAAQDDLVTVGKGNGYEIIQKPAVVQEKSAAFLRPAQRPLAGLKGFLSSSSNVNNAPTVATTKAPVVENPQPITKTRTLTKRATTIFRDNTAGERDSAPQLTSQSGLPVNAPAAPAHQGFGPRQHKSQPALKADHPLLRGTQSKIVEEVGDDLTEESGSATSTSEDASQQHSDLLEEQKPKVLEDKLIINQRADEVAAQLQAELERHNRRLPPLPLTSEPEEYWDEEDEEEIYDEQGYATAHSHKSRGDNTTGGATTLLVPKVTNKIKKELAIAKEIVESLRTPEEAEDEAWDTSMVAEYGDEIFQYMRELEVKMLPNAHYMDNQAEIQWSMRSVLMDWLIQVHHRFSLLPETLFLCVNYIDRFLSCKIVSLGKLQLVGATAIFVAAKYEEINCPSVGEIVYMVDGGYTVDEILKAERFMLSMLQFELGWPGPMSFLRRISKADDYDLETRTLAKYFLEVTIMDERFVGSPPSFIAAGAHCFARLMLKKGDWSAAHIYYSGYTWAQLKPLVTMIMECCENPHKHHGAVYEKYSDRRYKRASTFVRDEMRDFVLPTTQLSLSRQSLPTYDELPDHIRYEAHESLKRIIQVRV